MDWTPARGSEQAGRRPALVVSNNSANRFSPRVVVLAVTSQPMKHAYPFHVPVAADATNGLTRDSRVLCEQIMAIAKGRLDGYIGVLSPALMEHVDKGIRISLAL